MTIAELELTTASAATPSTSTTMKALVYHGPGKRAWENKPRPTLEDPGDAIVRITTSTICGTDLHILKGDLASVAEGRILGHEGIGVIEQVGTDVAEFSHWRQGHHLVRHCLPEVRLLQKRHVFPLPARRLDFGQHPRRNPGWVRAYPTCRWKSLPLPAG